MDPNHAQNHIPNHAPTLILDPVTAQDGTADPAVHAAVRLALTQHGALSVPVEAVAPDADLYALGLTSHATVNVMLAVENELDVEFPDELLTRTTFASVDALVAAATVAAR